MDMKISIVMAYFNRKKQLLNTLDSIFRYNHNIEIVIVDDGSNDGYDIKYLQDIDVVNIITLKDKTWINPCIPFNVGFTQATGDAIIIQNPECLHVGDIVGSVMRELTEGVYLNYAAYSIGRKSTERLYSGESIERIISPTVDQRVITFGEDGWYNHSKYHPTMLHFCSAIMRSDLYDLGGFDERYSDGLGFDDNELLTRILKKQMIIKMIDNPSVIHQHHEHLFDGDITPYMERNSLRWQGTKDNADYDVKKHNKIFT